LDLPEVEVPELEIPEVSPTFKLPTPGPIRIPKPPPVFDIPGKIKGSLKDEKGASRMKSVTFWTTSTTLGILATQMISLQQKKMIPRLLRLISKQTTVEDK
jgi:hypothetical protein